jgi:hypothetical protein
MRLRLDAWRPLLDLNRVDHGLLMPILFYCVDPSGRPMLGPPREGPETEGVNERSNLTAGGCRTGYGRWMARLL